MKKRIVIVGATSGIGLETAKIFVKEGWRVGAVGRNEEALIALKASNPSAIETKVIDITDEQATKILNQLIEELGGIDIYLHCSGVGYVNRNLNISKENLTVSTNVDGFVRMITYMYNYFANKGFGHIAIISSIAGTKGLGSAPSYSATKCFQNCYIDALDQLSKMNHQNIIFTDIRPGFVDTPLLKNDSFPLLMNVSKVSKIIYKSILKKRRVVIIDWKYSILVALWRLIPRCIWVRLPIHPRQ